MKNLIITIIAILIGLVTYSQEPVSYLQLQKVLPLSVKGCKMDRELDGMNVNVEGMVFSNASAQYKKGDITVELVLMDYNGSENLFNTTAEFLNDGLVFESKDGFARLINIDGKEGYIVGDSKTKTTVLIMVWMDRYVLNVNVSGKMDEAYAKSIYAELDLSELK
jgi:hypothetical protein